MVAAGKASDKLKSLLNQAIAREIQVSIQYMWQHVQTTGPLHHLLADELKKVAIEEMKHAEQIAERLWYLGGTPTTAPSPIFVGENLKEMMERDVKDEEEAIELYKEIIRVANEEGDITTARLFRKILEDEEEHHDFFTTVLEGL
ncbi:MAG: ferritin-like domain-containing protein [Candidatus Korarchaeota archaeon]|nr:ferritin-like domain-containing protein [Candidatus Korarchaeota archaeon]